MYSPIQAVHGCANVAGHPTGHGCDAFHTASLLPEPSQGPPINPDGPPQDFCYAEHDSDNPYVADDAPSLPYVTQDTLEDTH